MAVVAPGAWAVGVSGGADSVGLLALLRERTDLRLVAVHLDHEMRGAESGGDAEFVRELCRGWRIECVVARRAEVEAGLTDLPSNLSARLREVRRVLFERAAAERGLSGVLLGHHADDQAETIMQRLARGAGPAGLSGMKADVAVKEMRIVRPLLAVRREAVRAYLHEIGQEWREDSSNASDKYARNRLRKLLGREAGIGGGAVGTGGEDGGAESVAGGGDTGVGRAV